MMHSMEKEKTDCDAELKKQAEPGWFRILKAVVLIAGAWYFRHSRWFFPWVIGALGGGVGLYWLARKMTRHWTRPWLWWNRNCSNRNR